MKLFLKLIVLIVLIWTSNQCLLGMTGASESDVLKEIYFLKDIEGVTALNLASGCNWGLRYGGGLTQMLSYMHLIPMILRRSLTEINYPDLNGCPPLFSVLFLLLKYVSHGSIQSSVLDDFLVGIILLVVNGANVNFILNQDSKKMKILPEQLTNFDTPMHLICKIACIAYKCNGDETLKSFIRQIFEQLFKYGANINACNGNNLTPLNCAMVNGVADNEICCLLKRWGAK